MKQRKRRSPPQSREKLQPSVGIIFVLGDRVLIESSQLSEAELCAGFVNHVRGHEEFWSRLENEAQVPLHQDYITVPRGRVIFSAETGQYSLLLDRCILKNPKLVREIRERMNLPRRGVVVATDGHYRCAVCMNRSSF